MLKQVAVSVNIVAIFCKVLKSEKKVIFCKVLKSEKKSTLCVCVCVCVCACVRSRLNWSLCGLQVGTGLL